MPDFEDKIPLSEFSVTGTLHDTDRVPVIQADGQDWDNFCVAMLDLALRIVKDTEYISAGLNTSSKKIIGAINEVLAQAAKVDIASKINTPAPIMTFNDGGDDIPLKSLVTEILPIQAGSGVPSPQNVRAISGHDSIAINNPITANIFNPARSLNGYYFNANGTLAPAVTYSISDYLPTKTSMKIGTLANAVRFVFYDDKFEYISSYRETASVAQLNIPQDAKWVRFSYTNTDESNIQVVWGNTLPTYQAYQGINKTINLPSTIYGGSLECVEGQGISEWVNIASYAGETIEEPWLCSEAPFVSGTTPPTGSQVVYKTSIPTAITTSGANIPTLSGLNNIYTDCGDIQSLEYFNNKANDIATLIRLMTE